LLGAVANQFCKNFQFVCQKTLSLSIAAFGVKYPSQHIIDGWNKLTTRSGIKIAAEHSDCSSNLPGRSDGGEAEDLIAQILDLAGIPPFTASVIGPRQNGPAYPQNSRIYPVAVTSQSSAYWVRDQPHGSVCDPMVNVVRRIELLKGSDP